MNERAEMLPIGKWRAYFGPVDRATGIPTRFDALSEFNPDSPPAPWTELGWIKNFERSGAADLENVVTGTAGLDSFRFRKKCESKLAFEFCEWGKLQIALSASSQHINLLSGESYEVTEESASMLGAAADTLARFAVGDLVAVDVDLDVQSGFIGTGISGAFVKAGEQPGVNYVRATTFNVARVADKTATSLVLDKPLLGGAPLGNAKVQKVVGFVDREGASFLQEWSALFILDELAGGRVVLWYPRLQSEAESGEAHETIESSIEQLTLRARFRALPAKDDLDGETVLGSRYYFPAKSAPAY